MPVSEDACHAESFPTVSLDEPTPYLDRIPGFFFFLYSIREFGSVKRTIDQGVKLRSNFIGIPKRTQSERAAGPPEK